MADLQSLHRALSEAESGSRELDAMIAKIKAGELDDLLRDAVPEADLLWTSSVSGGCVDIDGGLDLREFAERLLLRLSALIAQESEK